jgi:hypothetical protein
VSDAGLTHIAALPNLKELDLRGTNVTDEGLARLARLKNLNRVWLSGTRVTDAGVADLKWALPSVKEVRVPEAA